MIIVTGGAGMTGAALVADLLQQGKEVIVIDDFSRGNIKFLDQKNPLLHIINYDLAHGFPDAWLKIWKGPVEQLYHLAARVGGVNYMQKDQWLNVRNCVVDWHVFEFCVSQKVPLLYVSTACVYPVHLQERRTEPNYFPHLKEEDVWDRTSPESIYGWAKLIGELGVQSLVKERGLNAKITRHFNVYGPREVPDPTTGHVIPALIYKALMEPGPELEVWGSGKQVRSYVYVDDVIQGMQQVAAKGRPGEVYNLGTTQGGTVKSLAETILAATDVRKTIKYDTSKPAGVHGRAADISKTVREIGWMPSTSLTDGIIQTVKWCREYLAGALSVLQASSAIN